MSKGLLERVLICVPTRGDRPLDLLVKALMDLRPEKAAFVLLVDASAGEQHHRMAAKYGSDLVVPTDVSGYASMRNFALQFAEVRGYRFIVFFDDDQVPMLGWFDSITEPIADTDRQGPEVVFGPVVGLGVGAGVAPIESMRSPNILLRPAGRYVGDVYSGNTLIDLAFVRRQSLQFDAKYDRSGGEDTDFFRRLSAAGGETVYAPNAIACEFIEPERRRVRSRYRSGQSMAERKVVLGRSRFRGTVSRILAGVRAVVFALRGTVSFDRSLLSEAAFWAGVCVGPRAKRS